jgi:uncharacterized protein (DUF885 family)
LAPPDYRELVRSFLDLRWQLDPVAATMAGVGTHDHRLGCYTQADVRAAVAALKAMAGAFEEAETSTRDDEIDQSAVLGDLRTAIARLEKERPHALNPEFHLTHLLNGLYTLLVRRDQPPAARARALAGRLKEVPRFLGDAEATLERPAAVFTETALEVARGGFALLDDAVPEFLEGVAPQDAAPVREAVEPARAALTHFSDFLEAVILPRSDGDFAIGRSAFDFRLHYEHALNDTAPELLRYGERLMREVEADLAGRAERLSSGIGWRDLAERLRSHHIAADAAVATYAREMERARRHLLERDLVGVPEGQLEVIATPSYMRPLIPFAAYDPPPAFGEDRTGFFYVTVPEEESLRDHCAHEIACTALHEGYPGHHLQHLVAQAQSSPVRRVVWTPLTVEGWALYCEELMAEQGLLGEPEELFFQRLHLLWRAARIVLDVRLHTMGLSVAEAVRYMVDTLGISRFNAEAEVRRYCSTPAYNLCYAVGRRELLSLRDDARRERGERFSLKNFHDEVLSYGGLPVALIRWGMGLADKREA